MPSTQLAIAAAIAAVALGLPPGELFAPSDQSDQPHSISVRALPTVAALFSGGDVSQDHTCTASVVSSTTGDLLITAAHCVSGNGKGMKVVPGYDAGDAPYGVWPVTAVFVDSAWQSDTSEADDVAFLRVARTEVGGTTRRLQDVTGANTLGDTPAPSTSITVQGFNAGRDDHAVSCTVGLDMTVTDPTFRCGGYVSGSSGSPWLATGADGVTRVTGVIGGPDEGGCTDATSYSPVFTAKTAALLARAERSGDDGDTAPDAGPASDCS
ncbi:serine protease [Allobranchiibius sp. GilTou73]|uniref:trypsin-like serine peptidase n=1 Tax=Allobranchiibius sp. GilTou73 TaxID=2904523 RepID=UPI001F40EB98|nr:trypsin-like serine protease [Allobranchiibius sp. GilTou73]UIJ35847.1 trypsin-like serine protease [Allobranchiibius sp. GilTou73]